MVDLLDFLEEELQLFEAREYVVWGYEVHLLLVEQEIELCSALIDPSITIIPWLLLRVVLKKLQDAEAEHLQIIPPALRDPFMGPGRSEVEGTLELLVDFFLNVSIIFKPLCDKPKVNDEDPILVYHKVACLNVAMNEFWS